MKRVSNVGIWALVAGGLLALGFWSPCASAGELQKFLDKSKAFAALPKVKHTPAFRLERFEPVQHRQEAQGKEWNYICDGDERIGLIQTWTYEIEMFRFSPTAGVKGAKYPIPEVYHWANLIGARIEIYGLQGVPPLTSFKLAFTKDRGDTLEFKVEHSHQGDIAGSSEYRLAWDERLGYVWTCFTRYSMLKPKAIEFNNLLAGGVSESRDSHKRWQKTVRALADGRIGYVHHNPLNIPKDDICPGGFVGYMTEKDMNPFVELIETSEPVSMVTCSQWYDQHIIMKAPQTKGADGLYHIQARYRFLSVPGPVAQELETAAVDLAPATGESGMTGFLWNKVNDFETTVPKGELYNGPIWQPGVNASAGAAHSGTKSIGVSGRGPGKVKSVSPIGGGPAIYGESGKRYRLAAWVKTRGLEDGGAYVQVDDVFFSWDDIQASRKTEKLSGDKDWTRLEVEFTPSPRDPLLNIKLCVEGTGTAWFDDLELMELK